MFKILLIVIVLIVFGTVFAAINFLSPKKTVDNSVTQSGLLSKDGNQSSSSASLLEQIKKINDQSSSVPGSDPQISTDAHIKLLEETVVVMQRRLDILEKNQTTGATTTLPTSTANSSVTNKSPVYIPVNSGGSLNTADWSNLTTGTATIDPADYPGYTTMNLITNLNVYQGNGRAYARVGNSSSSVGITASEVSVTSENATQVVSSGFQLPSGSATYTIQLKTLTVGYPAIAGLSFIKVNF